MIADVKHVRAVGNLSEAVNDDQILPHLRNARRRLISWVGQSAYDTAEAEVVALDEDPRDFTSEDLSVATVDLADAEAFLSLASGIPSWNLAIQASGNGAVGIHTSGVVGESTFTYLTPAQENSKAQEFQDRALMAAMPYLTDALGGGSPGPLISYALDSDGDVKDENWPENKVVNP